MALRFIRCFVCDRASEPGVMRTLLGENNDRKRQIATRFRENLTRPNEPFEGDSRICVACSVLIDREVAVEANPSYTRLKIVRSSGGNSCVVCRRANRRVQRLSLKRRTDIFISTGIYCHGNIRSCAAHLNDDGKLPRNLCQGLQFFDRTYSLAGRELHDFLQMLREQANAEVRDFSNEDCFSDEEFSVISPVNKNQFHEMSALCVPIMQVGGRRIIRKKDLLLFLCKLRQGLTDDLLKLMFGYNTRQSVSLAINNVRQSLMLQFVPQNIGLNAITHQEYVNNPDPDNRAPIVYIDGSYAYIEKSSNFQALRFSYCLHKGRHLIKPALLVAPDGYILDVHGPYFSDFQNNYASMLANEFETDAGALRRWLEEEAIIIVDRGYRDIILLLERLGIRCHMPGFLEPGQRQLTTEAANDSRLITKTRWIVEARNGHIKSIFKMFNGTIPYTHAKHLREFYLIAGAIINRFRQPILMEGATADLAQEILQWSRQPNGIQVLVEDEGLLRRNAVWERLEEDAVPEFPVFDMDYLGELTVGIYHIKLAPSYIQDKLTRDDTETLELDHHRIHPNLLRLRVFSRHRNRTTYQLFIRYTPRHEMRIGDEGLSDGPEPITGYYCTCKSGARTLGTCAHIAAVIWYLGYARHQANVKYPSDDLLHSVIDAGNRVNQL